MAGAVIGAVVSTVLEVGTQVIFGELVLSNITFNLLAKTFVKSLVLSALVHAIGGKGSGQQPSLAREAADRKQSIRGSISPRRIVWGRARLSGTLAYVGSTGSSHEYLWLVVAYHHGPLDAVEETYLNDLPIGDTRYSGKASATHHLGSSSQTADSALDAASTDWTSDHRLRGVGYAVLQLTYDATAFPSGLPNPSFVVRGRQVYDPRDATTAWSNNPALCILDYLIGTVPTASGGEPIGIGATLAEIDVDSFIAAANTCDEDVALAAGGTQKRYTCDGAVTLDASPSAIIEKLLTSCAGTLVYSGGQYRLFVGAPIAKTFTITADMLRGTVHYRARPSRRVVSNTVRGTFIDPANYFEATDYPVQTVAAYVAEDDGEAITQDTELLWTQDGIRAQRIAMQLLKRQRLGQSTIELPCNWSALGIAIMDTGSVVLDALGLGADRKWQVTDWRLAEGGGIDLVLREEHDEAYDWSTGDEQIVTVSPKPDMARADEVPDITGLVVSSASYATPEGAHIGALSLDWDDAASAFVVGYDIEARLNGTSPWTIAGSSAISETTIYGLAIGSAYDVRVRARRANGATGAWNQDLNTTVSGDVTAPSVPSGMTATALTGAIRVDWTNPGDGDFSKARLYRNTSNDSAGASLIDTIYGLPGQAGTDTDTVASGQTRYYWTKAVDASGNASGFSAGVSATAL